MATKIYAARCQQCGQLSYPTHYQCTACKCRRSTEVPIEGNGTLVTWTRVYSLSLDYVERYLTLGIVKMDMGVSATGRLEVSAPQSGMRLRSSVGKVREIDGDAVKGLVFSALDV